MDGAGAFPRFERRVTMSGLRPFSDDSASVAVGGLTVENGRERVAVYGSLDITRDAKGLADARALAVLLNQAVAVLEAEPHSAAGAAKPAAAKSVKNPFA